MDFKILKVEDVLWNSKTIAIKISYLLYNNIFYTFTEDNYYL